MAVTLAATIGTGAVCIGSAKGIADVPDGMASYGTPVQEDVYLEIQRQRAIQSGLAEKASMSPVSMSLYAKDALLSVLSERIDEVDELSMDGEDQYQVALSVQSEEIEITDPDPIEPTPEKKQTDPAARSDYMNYTPATSGCLTPRGGVFNGPSGKETYYNLPMGGVVRIMRRMGYSEEEWPYWVRDDGAKMLGNYIIVAAALDIRPRGTIVPTSLGDGIVCDTGTFALTNPRQLDLAMDW